ncbi:hypothetical protein G6R29_03960 [Fructobacillus sp. M2-14]|uniref:Uncharacterized protein n=1 Tax=Fructobacillus broussonetiae TaxID=2713173 RepID=A0ABS5R008_9LACO|nr:hypothetical protein [Fructobacillus broussonetiae]MBS9338778.1 hypothetical protein [Fructobacillus broussonetiae]
MPEILVFRGGMVKSDEKGCVMQEFLEFLFENLESAAKVVEIIKNLKEIFKK